MKALVSWLREYVHFEQSVYELAHLITIAGLNVEGIERVGEEWDNVYVGVVEQVEPHPNADRLVLATVDYGGGRLTIVTGAPNIAPGQKVALALEGAVLVDTHSETPKKRKLKASTIRGVRSEGMVCSEKELGLSEEDEGILVLDTDAPVGTPLSEVLGDYVLDIDLQPNFAYANSMVGLAREVAAITGAPLTLPQPAPLPSGNAGAAAEVMPGAAVNRYMLQRIEGIQIRPSPPYVQQRLRASGLRPINNVVDITNYVMLEYGQPLHAFDASVVEGHVVVRPAVEGERFTTLDHVTREVPAGTVMIADNRKAIGIGGIMGGLDSEVTDRTTVILLEAANFERTRIRRSARAMGLRTDASARFERELDPDLAPLALARAVELLRQEAGARPVGAPEDWYPDPQQPRPVALPLADTRRLLGISVPVEDVQRILESLGFEVSVDGNTVTALPPSYRRDVTRPADLVEEVGRIWGYDNVPAVLPSGELPRHRQDMEWLIERKAREWLVGTGLQEVINYDLTNPRELSSLAGLRLPGAVPQLWAPTDELLKVLNPVTSEREYLRPSLLPGILRNLRENLRHESRVQVFELDRIFAAQDTGLPNEPKRLAIGMVGPRAPASPHLPDMPTTIFDLKGVVEGLFRELNISRYLLQPLGGLGQGFLNGLSVEIGGACAGVLFQVVGGAYSPADLDESAVVAELEWNALLRAAGLNRQYEPFSRYPAVKQDLAVLVAQDRPAAEVEDVIHRAGGRMLQSASLVEVYTGEPLPPDAKSLLYRLVFQAQDRSLTESEVTRYRQAIEQALRERLGAAIRGTDAP